MKYFFAIVILGLAQVSLGQGQAFSCAKMKNPDCQAICSACENAGYVWKEAGIGKGLFVDCFRPLLQGTAEPSKAQKAGMTLPNVAASQIASCKASHPNK